MKNNKLQLLNDYELAAIKGGNPYIYWSVQLAIAMIEAYYSVNWSIEVNGYARDSTYIQNGDSVRIKSSAIYFDVKIGN
jgi:hypothetical protein